MEVKEIIKKEEWETFLSQCVEKTFLQSWNWGEFNSAMGNKIWRIGIYEDQKIIGVALVIKIKAKRGTFLFIPHGPVFLSGLTPHQKKESLILLLIHLNNFISQEKISFIRISPILTNNEENRKIFQDLNFREAPIHMHPEVTWEINLLQSEDELLKNMRKTTRYLIRHAQQNPDIKIIKSTNISDLDFFMSLYKETAKRHHFVIFSKEYLKRELEAFLPDNEILLFFGRYQEKTTVAAIFVFWQGICFYHHSGSSAQYNKIPVSYLLQWEAIKEAKRRACHTYNLWGIAPTENPKHPWAGLSYFKKGFGGEKKEYVKTQDLIISYKYWFNYLIEKIRKYKRGV